MQEMGDRHVLRMITEGMPVVDMNGVQVGVVDEVFLGNIADDVIETKGQGATSPAVDLGRRDSLIVSLAEALVPNEIPEELAERLLNNGYIQMDRGLFKRDRFIMPDQIAGIYDGAVRLKKTRDEMR